MAATCALLRIARWQPLDTGVLVVVHGVGRLRAEALLSTSATPYLVGRFSTVSDDVEDDDSDEKDTEQRTEELRCMEVRFWKLFQTVVDACNALSIPVWRTKQLDHVVEYTLKTVGDNSKLDADFARYVTQWGPVRDRFRLAAELAVGKEGAIEWGDPEDDAEAKGEQMEKSNEDVSLFMDRLTGISFAGFDLFESEPQFRQRAIESRCLKARLSLILKALELRQQELSVKVALKSALE